MTKRLDESDKTQLLLGNSGDLSLSVDDLCHMFHPDNIKNFTLDGAPVSISLH